MMTFEQEIQAIKKDARDSIRLAHDANVSAGFITNKAGENVGLTIYRHVEKDEQFFFSRVFMKEQVLNLLIQNKTTVEGLTFSEEFVIVRKDLKRIEFENEIDVTEAVVSKGPFIVIDEDEESYDLLVSIPYTRTINIKKNEVTIVEQG